MGKLGHHPTLAMLSHCFARQKRTGSREQILDVAWEAASTNGMRTPARNPGNPRKNGARRLAKLLDALTEKRQRVTNGRATVHRS